MQTTYRRSRYTLAEPLDDGSGGILVNTLTGAVDLVSGELARAVRTTTDYGSVQPGGDPEFLLERGYYVEDLEVEDAFARAIAQRSLRQGQALAEPKYMFFTTLRCNLTCSYCWQVQEHGGARQKTPVMSEEMIDAAFRFVDADMARRGAGSGVVSLFGGEPLIDRPQFRATVNAICEGAAARGLDIHFTTNGKHLAAFRDEVERFRPSIQATVDGFRPGPAPLLTRAGQKLTGLHEELLSVAGDLGLRVYMRFLVGVDTIEEFIAYADHLHAGAVPPTLSLGVAPIQNKSGPRGERAASKPEVLEHLLAALDGRDYARRLAFTDWRSLYLLNRLRGGEELLPAASFYHCEAQTHLFAFGSDGLLYTCYEAGGDPSLAVGRYFDPEGGAVDDAASLPASGGGCGGGCSTGGARATGPVPIQLSLRRPGAEPPTSSTRSSYVPEGVATVDEGHLRRFRERTAFAMPQCSQCALSPICGGGCQVRGIKKNGVYEFPYCDDLHDEVRFTMRSWSTLAEMLLPTAGGQV